MNENLEKSVKSYLKGECGLIEFKKDSLINFINENLDKFKKYSDNNIDDVPIHNLYYFLEEFDNIITDEILKKLEIKDLDKYFNFDFSLYDYETLSNAYLDYVSGLLRSEDNNLNLLDISEIIKESHNFIINIHNNQNLKDFLLSEYGLNKLYKHDTLLTKSYFIREVLENNFFDETKPTVNFNM